jgi:DNA-3-methyladenine glycosylase
LPEEQHANNEQERIDDAGNNDPAKKVVLLDKALCFSPGLDCYYDFFQQNLNLVGKYREREWGLASGEWGFYLNRKDRTMMKKISLEFYRRDDVLAIAQDLLGKLLVTKWNNDLTYGRIVEVEAYNGAIDRASHAAGGRRTARNEIMYADGGVAYVYLCYGIHHLFNVVTHTKETPHAVLIRGLEPLKGIDTMLQRVKKKFDHSLTRGPGNLSKAMGITTRHSGYSLRSKELFIADDGFSYSKEDIVASPRIGVDYAGEDALLPYRFYLKGNPFVSGKKVT